MALFYQADFTEKTDTLNAEESRHLAKVLRIKAGNEIHVTDGKGKLYRCTVTEANQKKTKVEIIATEKTHRSVTYRHIAIAPTKNMDRLEWFVEKAVEFGIDELSFVLCQNSERRVLKLDRIYKKAISAMKQSGNLYLPQINELRKFDRFVEQAKAESKCIAFVDFSNPIQLQEKLINKAHNIIVIGPEGDFTSHEVTLAENLGFKKVSLGNSRLRTETAGVAASHILNLFCN